MIPNKVDKIVGLLRKLNILPRSALLTNKAFVRPLDYDDINYQAYNTTFHQKLELMQYNACFSLTGATRGTSKEKIYEELDFESLQYRCWYKKLSYFYKFCKNEFPHYLFNLFPVRSSGYSARSMKNIPFFETRCNFLKSFSLSQPL